MNSTGTSTGWFVHVRLVGYFLAFQLILVPVIDFLTNVWPLQPGDVAWRYGALGLFSGFFLTPLLGFALGAGIGLQAGDRQVLLAVGGAAVAAGAMTVLAVPVFAIDVIQLRSSVTAEARSSYDTGALRAAIKYALGGPALVWLGIVVLRARRQLAKPGSGAGLVARPSGASPGSRV